LVTGAVLGPVAVAAFSTLRTLTRLPFQLVEIVKNGSWPEFSVAFGQKNFLLARQLHRGVLRICFWSSLASSTLLLVVGRNLVAWWTHNYIAVNQSVLCLLLMANVVSSVWNASSVALIAGNQHKRIAILYAIVNAVCLPAAYLLMPRLGTAAAALSILCVDLAMSLFVLRESTVLLSDRVSQVMIAALSAIWDIPSYVRQIRLNRLSRSRTMG
jgi:O-antigen/teichoic acid export membrane protein